MKPEIWYDWDNNKNQSVFEKCDTAKFKDSLEKINGAFDCFFPSKGIEYWHIL